MFADDMPAGTVNPELWKGWVSEQDMTNYRRAGFFRPGEFGHRPALLIIDAQYNFTGDKDEPVASSAERYRFSCGEYAWASLPNAVRLLDLARAKGMPVVYTQDIEQFPDATEDEAARGHRIVDALAPTDQDMVVTKMGYSGFFATRMLPHLISLNVDTLIICGGTTSGCVRASVTDAFDYRFRTFLVEDCVFDRAQGPHRANLFDMAGKSATVLSLDSLTKLLGDRTFHGSYSGVGDSPTWRYDLS